MNARLVVTAWLLFLFPPNLADADLAQQRGLDCGVQRHQVTISLDEHRVRTIRFLGGGIYASDRFEPAHFTPADPLN